MSLGSVPCPPPRHDCKCLDKKNLIWHLLYILLAKRKISKRSSAGDVMVKGELLGDWLKSRMVEVAQAEITWVLVHSIGQTPKMLDPTSPISSSIASLIRTPIWKMPTFPTACHAPTRSEVIVWKVRSLQAHAEITSMTSSGIFFQNWQSSPRNTLD